MSTPVFEIGLGVYRWWLWQDQITRKKGCYDSGWPPFFAGPDSC